MNRRGGCPFAAISKRATTYKVILKADVIGSLEALQDHSK